LRLGYALLVDIPPRDVLLVNIPAAAFPQSQSQGRRSQWDFS